MSTIKKVEIQNSSGTGYDSRDVGAEAQYIDISRDVNGNIIPDITATGVVVASTEPLTQTLTFDTIPTQNSKKGVTSGGVYTAIQADSALSMSSTKPVQNKVITTELNKKQASYTGDATKWDTVPTASSTKPVTSGGIKTAIDAVGNSIAASEVSPAGSNHSVGEQILYNGGLYKVTSTITAGDLLVVGTNISAVDTVTTQINSLNTAVNKCEVLVLEANGVASLPYTFTNSEITTDMVCIHSEIGDPSVQGSDWEVDTDTAGYCTIKGTFNGSTGTSVKLYLIKSR